MCIRDSLIVERTCGLLSVARDKRNGVPLVQQHRGRFRLRAPYAEFLGDSCQNIQLLSDVYKRQFRIRAKYEYDKKRNSIDILEIPYTTSIENIMDKIAELIKDVYKRQALMNRTSPRLALPLPSAPTSWQKSEGTAPLLCRPGCAKCTI